MTKTTERDETITTTETATATAAEQPRRTTAGVVVRAVALGLLAGTVGMTTACCQGVGAEGEGEGE